MSEKPSTDIPLTTIAFAISVVALVGNAFAVDETESTTGLARAPVAQSVRARPL